jgi:hypothetical protein
LLQTQLFYTTLGQQAVILALHAQQEGTQMSGMVAGHAQGCGLLILLHAVSLVHPEQIAKHA